MSLKQQLQNRMDSLRPHFKPHFLQRERTVFRFLFDDGEPFHLIVKGNDFLLAAGEPDNFTLTLLIDCHETCWQLLTGTRDSMAAFLEGKYRADGNIVLSQLLLYLFRPDDATIAYEVKD